MSTALLRDEDSFNNWKEIYNPGNKMFMSNKPERFPCVIAWTVYDTDGGYGGVDIYYDFVYLSDFSEYID